MIKRARTFKGKKIGKEAVLRWSTEFHSTFILLGNSALLTYTAKLKILQNPDINYTLSRCWGGGVYTAGCQASGERRRFPHRITKFYVFNCPGAPEARDRCTGAAGGALRPPCRAGRARARGTFWKGPAAALRRCAVRGHAVSGATPCPEPGDARAACGCRVPLKPRRAAGSSLAPALAGNSDRPSAVPLPPCRRSALRFRLPPFSLGSPRRQPSLATAPAA